MQKRRLGTSGLEVSAIRGGRADHPSRSRGPAGHRGPERVLAVVATPRSGSAADGRGARHRLRPLQPARPGFLTGTIDQRTTLDSTDIRTTIPRFTPEARRANQALVDLLGRIAARKHATPPRSRSPGCWPRSPGSCRSPARAVWDAWRRTSEPSTSSSPPTTTVRSIAPPHRSRSREPGTPNTWSD
jgi:hypothetical protein